MMISFQEIIALLPVLIIGVTVVCIMLCISFFRNHFIISSVTFFSLKLSLLSLYFTKKYGAQIVTDLVVVDNFSIFFSVLILFASLASSVLAYTWLDSYLGNREEFYLLILISVMGGILLVCTNHLVMIFLSIELLAVPLYGLIGYNYAIYSSLSASVKYIILSTISSSFLLFGIALIYAYCSTLSIIDINNNSASNVISQELFLIGLGFMIASFGFKLSLFPFHSWTADVYAGSSIPVNLFLSTVNKIAVFAMMLRIFPVMSSVCSSTKISFILVIIACFSMLFGNLIAIRQNNIKRILGYSSIAHFGYILIGLLSKQNNELSLETVGISLVSYLLSSLGIFGILSLISTFSKNRERSELFLYRGLFWDHPFLSVVFTVMILSLAGIPITLGFISKFYVIILGVHSELWWFIGSVLLSSVIGLVYYLRIIRTLYSFSSKRILCNIPWNWGITPLGMIILISFVLILFLGIYPQPLINLTQLLYK
ncbi:NADH-quinone oxidoreductase subunit NuoN [Blochmannia endosymbiont of Camponotus (Colobopsis) obliquus]|uniref:NADH-quinone oxidoreductase subunit NuoN n=1 Tax=Blochmannia endosymbiont of Camponotus (Colobopsis) obliquus TaxID=1505597 RepID=UPI00061A5B94|nr:NADH-quinone oxidoreductase subunit NuoN [Blochmannia endosymbiont of Camponotus (Colobopsis) obliquus]AKC60633.1 NADH-quinone oxidoreductase subunit N [Blochmannia endosymbiont of Camponotus (Colobopsis) obliquus]